jgi:acyl-CoA reductase-like NAD-dependent aldehyde dehydrogenase
MKFLAARHPEFMTLLFPDQWNSKTKSWHSPSGVLPAIKRGIKVMAGFPAWQKPSPVDAARIVRGLVQISDARKTDFRTITIVDTSGKRAVALLNILHNGADEMLRMRDREQSEKRVAYLRDKLKVETEISQRDSLTQLLKEEDRRLMLSHIDVPYSVKIVTPPEVFPTTPNSRLAPAIILGLLFGGAIGAAFALFHGFRPHRRPFGK